MFNPVAPYRYLLPTVYLFVPDIVNLNLFVCACRTWICIDIARFYEERCHPSIGSAPAWPACKKTVNLGPPLMGSVVSTQFAQQSAITDVTAPPLICCIDWSLIICIAALSHINPTSVSKDLVSLP